MRRPVRRKKGRVVVALDTRQTRTKLTVGSRSAPAPDLATSIERLAVELMLLSVARADKRAGRAPEETTHAIESRIARLRKVIGTMGPEAVEHAAAVTRALGSHGGRLLSMVERSHVTVRPYATRAGGYLASYVLNGMRVPMALVQAGSAAANEALADMLRDLLVAQSPMTGLAATTSKVIDDKGRGLRVTQALPTFDALAKMYLAISTAARQDKLAALALEEQGREAEKEMARAAMHRQWEVTHALAAAQREDARGEEDQGDVGASSNTLDVSGVATVHAEDAGMSDHVVQLGIPAVGLRDGKKTAEEDDDEDWAPTWCDQRKRLVPKKLAGTRPPGAWLAREYPKARDEEKALLDEFDRRVRESAWKQAARECRW